MAFVMSSLAPLNHEALLYSPRAVPFAIEVQIRPSRYLLKFAGEIIAVLCRKLITANNIASMFLRFYFC